MKKNQMIDKFKKSYLKTLNVEELTKTLLEMHDKVGDSYLMGIVTMDKLKFYEEKKFIDWE